MASATVDQKWFASSVSKIVTVRLEPHVPSGDRLFLIAHAPSAGVTVTSVVMTGGSAAATFLTRVTGNGSVTEYWDLGVHNGGGSQTVIVTFSGGSNTNATVLALGGVGV